MTFYKLLAASCIACPFFVNIFPPGNLFFGTTFNQLKNGKFVILEFYFGRKEGEYFIGRTEYDSHNADNEVIADATKHYIQIGQFFNIKITEATDFDLYGEPVIF